MELDGSSSSEARAHSLREDLRCACPSPLVAEFQAYAGNMIILNDL